MGERNQPRSEESLRHEYTEVVQNIRHYSNLRFAVFSIFFAVLGGVGIVAFGKGQFDEHAAVVARIGGFPVIALFWCTWSVWTSSSLITSVKRSSSNVHFR